jgi:hypothetical protein
VLAALPAAGVATAEDALPVTPSAQITTASKSHRVQTEKEGESPLANQGDPAVNTFGGHVPTRLGYAAEARFYSMVGARVGVEAEMSSSSSFLFAIAMRRAASSKYSA